MRSVPVQPTAMHAVYRASTEAAAERSQPVSRPAATAGAVLVEGHRDGISLHVVVSTRDHVVRAAGYEGATSTIARGLLETLRQVIIGVTVAEAADHGVLSVAERLRDQSLPPPAPGLVIPESVDPAFAWLQQLVRQVAAEYQRTTAADLRSNTFERKASADWLALPDAGKMSRVREAVTALAGDRGIGESVEVIALEDGLRVVLGFQGEVAPKQKQGFLMALERALQDGLEPRLEVCLEELKDRNVIRRLKPPQEVAHVRND